MSDDLHMHLHILCAMQIKAKKYFSEDLVNVRCMTAEYWYVFVFRGGWHVKMKGLLCTMMTLNLEK